MGVVYEAEDTNLGRRVAIKFLPEEMAEDRQALERFQREARAASALNHPNICTIHDLGEHHGQPFLVMELLEGATLKERLAGRRFSAEEVVELGIQLSEALEVAHQAGIVHRDIKPANVFLTERGVAKILDFGLAKRLVERTAADSAMPTALDEDPSLTSPGSAVGTVAYMSPEQVRGESIDARTDLFSLGVVLYQMACGDRPFSGATTGVVFNQILSREPIPPARIDPRLSPGLDQIIRKLLEKDRALRYQSARELVADLKRLRRDSESARGVTVTAEAGGTNRGRWVAGLIFAVVLAAAAFIWWQIRAQEAASGKRTSPSRPEGGLVSESHPTVAVLPFQNLSGDESTNYLGVAVPDEIITTLSRVETLAVRPFASTASYTGPGVDLHEVGSRVRAVHLVTGQYFREGERLNLTLEAVDVEGNRLLWRESVAVPADDLLGLREQVADRVREGLVSILAPRAETSEAATRPTDPEAYELFLKSLTVERTPERNKEAIAMLERAVELDPGFARYWAELALRLHFDAHYAGGGAPVYEREAVAIERALELDPDLPAAGEQQVVFLVDEGKLLDALEIANRLVVRHPEKADVYFARSYVRRYASLIDAAIADCERSRRLDPTNYRIRSCANNFILNGTYERASVFYELDRNSDFYYDSQGHLELSRRRPEKAWEWWSQLPPDYGYAVEGELLGGYLRGDDIRSALDEFLELMEVERDPESLYFAGELLVFVGREAAGFEMVRRAIEGNYCAATGLAEETFWEPYRAARDPRYLEVLEMATACRERFALATG